MRFSFGVAVLVTARVVPAGTAQVTRSSVRAVIAHGEAGAQLLSARRLLRVPVAY